MKRGKMGDIISNPRAQTQRFILNILHEYGILKKAQKGMCSWWRLR